MTITKRTDKGSALTFAEMDENIRDLREDTDLTRVLNNGSNTTLDLTTTGTITADVFVGTLISANSASEIDINTINAVGFVDVQDGVNFVDVVHAVIVIHVVQGVDCCGLSLHCQCG